MTDGHRPVCPPIFCNGHSPLPGPPFCPMVTILSVVPDFVQWSQSCVRHPILSSGHSFLFGHTHTTGDCHRPHEDLALTRFVMQSGGGGLAIAWEGPAVDGAAQSASTALPLAPSHSAITIKSGGNPCVFGNSIHDEKRGLAISDHGAGVSCASWPAELPGKASPWAGGPRPSPSVEDGPNPCVLSCCRLPAAN